MVRGGHLSCIFNSFNKRTFGLDFHCLFALFFRRTRSTTSSTPTLTSTCPMTRHCWSWASRWWRTTTSGSPCCPPSVTTSPPRTASPLAGARHRVTVSCVSLVYKHSILFWHHNLHSTKNFTWESKSTSFIVCPHTLISFYFQCLFWKAIVPRPCSILVHQRSRSWLIPQ